ncbi:MAG: CDP-alcohol phosphatidyltransferase family protein [Gammaproteobacteria bacterium]|nr:CDP-alcohol phosphatidyltransferase family protein [Gammaproteobacteria bacterium]
MLEQACRNQYQVLCVDRVAQALQYKVGPNTVTLLSGILGFLVLPALYFGHILLAISLLLLSGYCDTLDGTLARLTQKSTDWGSVLDIVIDRFVEFIVVLALLMISPESRGFWCLMMLGSMLLCITSFLVVGIFSENHSNKGFHYSVGLMERAEAFIFFIAMMIWPSAFDYLAAIFTVLVGFTALSRLYGFYLNNKGYNE